MKNLVSRWCLTLVQGKVRLTWGGWGLYLDTLLGSFMTLESTQRRKTRIMRDMSGASMPQYFILTKTNSERKCPRTWKFLFLRSHLMLIQWSLGQISSRRKSKILDLSTSNKKITKRVLSLVEFKLTSATNTHLDLTKRAAASCTSNR